VRAAQSLRAATVRGRAAALSHLPGRTVEVRTDPGPKGYRHCEIYGVGETVPSPAEGVPDLDVAWLFDGLGD
jgi:hypothetical protein